ncbi:MAG TPA: hypothetical protein VH639_15015 [Bryobacteraceae bacterium]
MRLFYLLFLFGRNLPLGRFAPETFVRKYVLTSTPELIDGMERALTQLRSAQGSARWREAVVESAAVLSGAISGLLENLGLPPQVVDGQVQAHRFASVKVAEMQLYHSAQVREGQEARDLYSALKTRIDEARASFLERFLKPGILKQDIAIPDYLHREIVRALAHNDETLLGPTYPGPLV